MHTERRNTRNKKIVGRTRIYDVFGMKTVVCISHIAYCIAAINVHRINTAGGDARNDRCKSNFNSPPPRPYYCPPILFMARDRRSRRRLPGGSAYISKRFAFRTCTVRALSTNRKPKKTIKDTTAAARHATRIVPRCTYFLQKRKFNVLDPSRAFSPSIRPCRPYTKIGRKGPFLRL